MADYGVGACDERATRHRAHALKSAAALDGDAAALALTQAILAVEARLDELCWWVAQSPGCDFEPQSCRRRAA